MTEPTEPAVTLHPGDCRDILPTLPEASCDACVTDPPYMLGFMGLKFDDPKDNPAADPALWRAVLRVLKPGALLAAFGGTRKHHRLMGAVEDAGFVIEDAVLCGGLLAWVQAQGWPKHRSKLKPAWEPVVCARKPGPKWLGVDAGRVPAPGGLTPGGCAWKHVNHHTYAQDGWTKTHAGFLEESEAHPGGRWPPNFCLVHHSDCRPAGTRRVRAGYGWVNHRGGPGNSLTGSVDGSLNVGPDWRHGDADGTEVLAVWECVAGCPVAALDRQAGAQKGVGPGSTAVSRFFPTFAWEDADFAPAFFCPKASQADRGAGNRHSTVKPTRLMRWLCRLACPPGGVILDPFLGSGTTALAARAEGFSCVGIERDPAWIDVTRNRLDADRAATPLLP